MSVVILGGGTSGWMSAAALMEYMRPKGKHQHCQIRLIESDEIGTVGVGEATLPQIRDFNEYLEINEAEFMRKTNASFKLGIEFVNWGKIGNRYHHPFGSYGLSSGGVDPHHHWARAKTLGLDYPLEAYSYAIQAAKALKFDFPTEDASSIRSTFSYAYHFDAGQYAAFLREYCEARGLERTAGTVVCTEKDENSGCLLSITLDSGEVVRGDLFIDCSGFRALLIGNAFNTEWEDWSKWLPCDRAIAVASERAGDFTPYTRSTAEQEGWRWRIPLQHRTGNGYVFSQAFMQPDAAYQTLIDNLDGAPQADPRLLKFSAGRRASSWVKNCVSIGLSSGFLEPLESTSIHLVQVAITNLLELFPIRLEDRDLTYVDERLCREFNRRMDLEYERIRDFLILHYHANTRSDGELWKYTRHMTIPDTLIRKMDNFRKRGLLAKYKDGLFSPASWLSVLVGQDIAAEGYDRLADNFDSRLVLQKLNEWRDRISSNVEAMPNHADFVRDYCFISQAKSGVHYDSTAVR